MVDAIPQRIKLIRKQVLWPRDGEKRFSSKIKTLVFGKVSLKNYDYAERLVGLVGWRDKGRGKWLHIARECDF